MARRIAQRTRSSPGWVFTPFDFLDLGSPHSVGMVLTRMMRSGDVRRLARGLYDVPRHNPTLGVLWPTIEAITKALQGKDGVRLQQAGVHAANLLGLSEQVPARVVFLTDGATRMIKVGPMRISLRRTTPRNMAAAGRLSGLVIQAFRSLGKQHITAERLARLRKNVPANERRRLLDDLALAPAWMHPHLRALAEP